MGGVGGTDCELAAFIPRRPAQAKQTRFSERKHISFRHCMDAKSISGIKGLMLH